MTAAAAAANFGAASKQANSNKKQQQQQQQQACTDRHGQPRSGQQRIALASERTADASNA
jgi:hypothetical protein